MPEYNGIYYPEADAAPADIPAYMELFAESIENSHFPIHNRTVLGRTSAPGGTLYGIPTWLLPISANVNLPHDGVYLFLPFEGFKPGTTNPDPNESDIKVDAPTGGIRIVKGSTKELHFQVTIDGILALAPGDSMKLDGVTKIIKEFILKKFTGTDTKIGSHWTFEHHAGTSFVDEWHRTDLCYVNADFALTAHTGDLFALTLGKPGSIWGPDGARIFDHLNISFRSIG